MNPKTANRNEMIRFIVESIHMMPEGWLCHVCGFIQGLQKGARRRRLNEIKNHS